MKERIQQLEAWRQEAVFKADIFRAQTTGRWERAAIQRDKQLADQWAEIALRCVLLINCYQRLGGL